MALFVGLDLLLKTTSICVVEADGSAAWEGKAESERITIKVWLYGRWSSLVL